MIFFAFSREELVMKNEKLNVLATRLLIESGLFEPNDILLSDDLQTVFRHCIYGNALLFSVVPGNMNVGVTIQDYPFPVFVEDWHFFYSRASTTARKSNSDEKSSPSQCGSSYCLEMNYGKQLEEYLNFFDTCDEEARMKQVQHKLLVNQTDKERYQAMLRTFVNERHTWLMLCLNTYLRDMYGDYWNNNLYKKNESTTAVSTNDNNNNDDDNNNNNNNN